jgi:hypothetical protein
MTEQELKADLQNRGIRLRTAMPDGTPIDLYNSRGGDYLSVPIADYESNIVDVINAHPNLSQEQKDIVINYFVYAMAIVEVEGVDQAYTQLTWQEYDVLYNGVKSGQFQFITDPTVKVVVVEIPKMDDDTGERSLLYLLGLDLPKPQYTLFARSERVFKLLENITQ